MRRGRGPVSGSSEVSESFATRRHMPQTVTGAPFPLGARRKDLLLPPPVRRAVEHDKVSGLRSAPVHVGARRLHSVRDGPLQLSARRTSHSTTKRRSRPPCATVISRSVRLRPSAYSRSIRPPPLTIRCRCACSSNCGPASWYRSKRYTPVFGMLPEERVERRDQPLHVQPTVRVHVPRHPLR